MEQKAIEALQGSIRKWDQIVKGEIPSYGTANCPLCAVFYGSISTSEDEACVGCPVREKTGLPVCEDTPYEDFVANATKRKSPGDIPGWWAVTKPAKAAARSERDFLISLLPEGTPTGLEEKKSDSSSPVPNATSDPMQDRLRGGGPG